VTIKNGSAILFREDLFSDKPLSKGIEGHSNFPLFHPYKRKLTNLKSTKASLYFSCSKHSESQPEISLEFQGGQLEKEIPHTTIQSFNRKKFLCSDFVSRKCFGENINLLDIHLKPLISLFLYSAP